MSYPERMWRAAEGQTTAYVRQLAARKRVGRERRPRQLAAALAFGGGAATPAGLDRAGGPAVAAAIAARARRVGSRRVGGCPTCGRPVRSDEDRVQLEGAVFHTGCAWRTQGD